MAVFQEHTYHEDAVAKRPLTPKDVEFLLALQKEMNTQDTMCEADPRYWVIKQSEWEPSSLEDSDDCSVVYGRDKVAEDIQAFSAWLADRPEVLRDDYTYVFDTVTNETKQQISRLLVCNVHSEEDDGSETWFFNTPERVKEFLDEFAEDEDAFLLCPKRKISRPVRCTFFLTHKSCENELRRRSYAYHEDAHAYAMTSPDPDVIKLYKILQQADWASMLSKSDALDRAKSFIEANAGDEATEHLLIALLANVLNIPTNEIADHFAIEEDTQHDD